jgi:flagellar hook protein FlgE
MNTAFTSGLSALQASATALNSSAHNLANLQTPDYKAQRVTFREASPSGVVAQQEQTQEPTDLGQETLNQLKVRRLSQAAVASLKAGEELLGIRLDRRV